MSIIPLSIGSKKTLVEQDLKIYDEVDVEFIFEWVGKYFEIKSLINEAYGGSRWETFPKFPSLENEIEYQRLSYWFREKHNRFVPIWVDFCEAAGITPDFSGDSDRIDYRENPFIYYNSENLLDLAYQMGVTCSPDFGYIEVGDIGLLFDFNERFSFTAMRLANWIGEFAKIGA